jgi:hypothetical protein
MKKEKTPPALAVPGSHVPVLDEVDVLVVGGGMAGIMASLAAARKGARTALVERYGFLGGMATNAMVGPFAGTRHRYGGGRIVGGIAWEFIQRLVKHDGALLDTYDYPLPESEKPDKSRSAVPAKGDIPFDPEVVKWTADQMIGEAGVLPYYHRFASGVVAENNRIKAVILESKSGRAAITARILIDATGDADIAYLAGVPWQMGRTEDKAVQPMTLMFRMGGVDTEAFDDITYPYISPRIRKLAQEWVNENKLPVFGGPWTFWGSTIRRGEVMVNMVRLWGDATDPEVLTRNEITGRDHIQQFVRFLKENISEFKNSFLIDSGPQIGIRETRRIEGEYQLTEVDILENRRFPDSIALGGHVIDIHSPTKSYNQVRKLVDYYRIPYRCLLPKKISNLLVAGRPISATHEAHASLRVMGTGMATGQAAGIAAGLCIEKNGDPRDVPAVEIQKVLEAWAAPFEQGIHDGVL